MQLTADIDDINEIDECENCGSGDLARDGGTHAVCLDCDHRQLLFTDDE
jgi:hypothetical protein